jgi:hypothetical protein
MHTQDDLVREQIEEWLAIAVADLLDRLGSVAKDLGNGAEALAPPRNRNRRHCRDAPRRH